MNGISLLVIGLAVRYAVGVDGAPRGALVQGRRCGSSSRKTKLNADKERVPWLAKDPHGAE
jgi:hypothetical protein